MNTSLYRARGYLASAANSDWHLTPSSAWRYVGFLDGLKNDLVNAGLSHADLTEMINGLIEAAIRGDSDTIRQAVRTVWLTIDGTIKEKGSQEKEKEGEENSLELFL